MNDIWKNYPRLDYQITPQKVSFSKNYAQVLCEEVINGTVSGSSFFNGEGIIQAKAQTIYYLKKVVLIGLLQELMFLMKQAL
ncbi:MAG: hypothetical protein L6V95_00785 [Candidatus Melainabacteria bacterium]|nr:MAG: hypothetical protein L6V95_00785 [Candidatus Melainabacteria bacterium]